MAAFYTEADYEESVVELFRDNMDYTYVYGPDVERDFNSPLYDEILIESVHRINKGTNYDAIKEALFKLRNFENGELVQKNAVFMDYLQNGIPVRYVEREKRSQRLYIWWITRMYPRTPLLWQTSGHILRIAKKDRMCCCSLMVFRLY